MKECKDRIGQENHNTGCGRVPQPSQQENVLANSLVQARARNRLLFLCLLSTLTARNGMHVLNAHRYGYQCQLDGRELTGRDDNLTT